MESVHARNERIAAELNAALTERGVFAVNVIGAPGVGKTSSLLELIKRLPCPCAVVEGDIASDLDTRTLEAQGIPAKQINTGGACHLEPCLVSEAAQDVLPNGGILFIENIGNLVCPAEFMIGEHVKLLLCAVTEGSDKPYKYPLAFEKANAILLNKCDLQPYVDFDQDFFMRGVRRLNTGAPVFHVAAKTRQGWDEVALWLQEQAKRYL